MNSILANHPIEERAGFWGRQFCATQTSGQAIFDIGFGVLMPLFCFYSDPGIIRGTFASTLGQVSIFVYGFSGLAIATLSIWLVFGHRMHSLAAPFGGILLAGATVSISIGVLILPYTLIGIFFVIGLLGFVPFITGFVYLRNGLRAISQAGSGVHRSPLIAKALVSAMLAIGLPGAAQLEVNRIIEQSFAEILNSNSLSVEAPVARIKRLRLVFETDRLVREYEKDSDETRRERLGRAYKEITGEEIERRLHVLND